MINDAGVVVCDVCGDPVHGVALRVVLHARTYHCHPPKAGALRTCGIVLARGFERMLNEVRASNRLAPLPEEDLR